MEQDELKLMWQRYDQKLDQSLKLNLQFMAVVQAQKVKSKVSPLFWYRLIELVLHFIALSLLVVFLVYNIGDWRYAASAGSLLIFYILAIYNCINQVLIITRMDYSNDIATIQGSLVKLKVHAIAFARIAILCIPTFLSFPMVVSKAIEDLGLESLSFMDIRSGYKGNWWSVQLVASCVLVPFCTWLFFKLRYQNIAIGWVKDTIRRSAGTRVMNAIEFVNDLEDLKKNYVKA